MLLNNPCLILYNLILNFKKQKEELGGKLLDYPACRTPSNQDAINLLMKDENSNFMLKRRKNNNNENNNDPGEAVILDLRFCIYKLLSFVTLIRIF